MFCHPWFHVNEPSHFVRCVSSCLFSLSIVVCVYVFPLCKIEIQTPLLFWDSVMKRCLTWTMFHLFIWGCHPIFFTFFTELWTVGFNAVCSGWSLNCYSGIRGWVCLRNWCLEPLRQSETAGFLLHNPWRVLEGEVTACRTMKQRKDWFLVLGVWMYYKSGLALG